VAGIGDPGSFSRVLEEILGPGGELLSFPDHHTYGWGDVDTILQRARGRPIVTTEKDAVKLEAFGARMEGVRALRLGVEVVEGEERLWHHVEAVLAASSRRRETAG
jgi:tetraacyldisaccharide-1-P 4'-kinase